MRYLILSDIHGNLPAFEAVLADAGQFDQIWCLGDIIGYGPQPNECIARLRQFAHSCVAGNHDWAAINKLDISAFNPEARKACLWTREQLTPEHWEYIERLPEKLVEGNFTLVHGSPRYPIWEYMTHPSVAAANLACYDTAYCLFGHTHIPVVYVDNGSPRETETLTMPIGQAVLLPDQRWLINPGGVGQPRDGDPRAAYLIYDQETNMLQQRRVEYPIEETQRLMAVRHLPDRLAARLLFGW
ncbi:MAG: phosphodiesterase [Chloroflexi bacterium ADurb.Bin180]|nr:MAG: phosphodiesterase [Chloroflexi bacterium ADurb.Bin180]HNR95662.1 metallophosphoesterase family protein [Anaerolineae bacterium]HOU24373.1 metallophosphoesterase family protein [Anaerolineae bacterium]HQJ50207.1 metallophosphoesterase family protein [Anaerolineae bacterium]